MKQIDCAEQELYTAGWNSQSKSLCGDFRSFRGNGIMPGLEPQRCEKLL